ncbi:DUF1326 domain-containing protein [Profundibacterium mesophilum]|uniref:DUF1326 domain-containing protein n=1 Tax=Profundibacterium mesophilum KAUST100406-0324 TaxID=1037889 RepID=A0A921TE78_9RHOB|nr:DUF1326 domain-containing protein [Profundibacterium mesophilum]KAF0677548.1 hypothetical protein PMES_00053 [Profundibacterium mesophilum KAUST100406-0324]
MARTQDKAPSDRLRVRDRIVQQMANPLRRKSQPTEWRMQGELFLNCSCDVFCPCVVSLGQHPPTEGHCHAWMAIAVDKGHFEGEPLDGINIGLLVDIPGRMAEGNWKVAAYIDERASQKAYNGLLKILSGAAGGTTGLFTLLVSEIIGAERETVEIRREGNRRAITIGRKIQGEIEMLAGASPEHPVMVSNSKYWMGPDIIAARGLKSRVRDYGRVWDFGGKSAELCPIDWSGPGK